MTVRRRRLPGQETLHSLLDYDPKTGITVWRPRPVSYFAHTKWPERQANAWNAAYAGKPCMTAALSGDPSNGRQAVILGKHYVAARIIWKMVYGDEPEEVIAINGDLSDLRLANLKASAKIYTGKNRTMFKNNTSGVRGVIWDSGRSLWRAEIRSNGKTTQLGRFTTIERAAAARRAAEVRDGFDLSPAELPQ